MLFFSHGILKEKNTFISPYGQKTFTMIKMTVKTF